MTNEYQEKLEVVLKALYQRAREEEWSGHQSNMTTATIEARAAINALNAETIGKDKDLHTWDVFGRDPRNNIGSQEIETVNDMNKARRYLRADLRTSFGIGKETE